MAKKLFVVSNSKGSLPLGSKGKVSQSDFAGGVSTTKKAARINTGKNTANARSGNNGKKALKLSSKDGMRSGGDARLSNKTKGPSGIRSKKGRLK